MAETTALEPQGAYLPWGQRNQPSPLHQIVILRRVQPLGFANFTASGLKVACFYAGLFTNLFTIREQAKVIPCGTRGLNTIVCHKS